MLNLSVKNR